MNDPIPTDVPGLTLRFATPDDVPLIHEFIAALASYERLAREVVATEDGLARWLFGDDPAAEVVIADHDGEAAGFALFFRKFSTFLGQPGIHLEDLFVRPEKRGLGIGEKLLAFLGRVALDRGYGRLEWIVLDWNEPALRFYRRLGARAMDDWTGQRVDGEALHALAARFSRN